MNIWPDYINHQIDISKKLDADITFSKIYLMSHLARQICQYRSFQQYSAERPEQAHNTNLNDGWNASNHNLNYQPKVITFQRRILCFEIRELNLQTLTQHWENTAVAYKVFPSGADLATPLCCQTDVKSEFMGLQNGHDGNHPDAMINDFRALLDNMQDETHRVAIYSGTREFIKHKSRNKMYISDQQLHAMDLFFRHGIKIRA
jgi:hypothetical protein